MSGFSASPGGKGRCEMGRVYVGSPQFLGGYMFNLRKLRGKAVMSSLFTITGRMDCGISLAGRKN